MTISQAISHFDALTPNQLPVPVKVLWLSQLDSLLHQECLALHEGSVPAFSGYDGDTELSATLLVPHPYDEVYRWYLEMKTWDTLGETAKYNNAAQKYNTALISYMDHVNRSALPLTKPLRLV